MSEVIVTKDLENSKLVIEYTASGPKDKVWSAYTEKDLFEKWWGPEGWNTTTKEFNLVPGGRVHYGMKCVDERQSEWYGKFAWGVMQVQEVTNGESFTYQDFFSDEDGVLDQNMPALMVTNEFIEHDGKTRIVSTSFADSPEQIEELIKMGVIEGFSSQLAKLDALFA